MAQVATQCPLDPGRERHLPSLKAMPHKLEMNAIAATIENVSNDRIQGAMYENDPRRSRNHPEGR